MMFLRLVLMHFAIQHIAFTKPQIGLGIVQFMEIHQEPETATQPTPTEKKLLSLDSEDTKSHDHPAGGPPDITSYPDVVARPRESEFGAWPLFKKYPIPSLLVHMVGILAVFWCICITCAVIKHAIRADFRNAVLATFLRRQVQEPPARFFIRGPEFPDHKVEVKVHGRGK